MSYLTKRKLTPLPLLFYSSMKQIYKEEELDIPEGITVAIKARIITVVGPRGTLQKVRTDSCTDYEGRGEELGENADLLNL